MFSPAKPAVIHPGPSQGLWDEVLRRRGLDPNLVGEYNIPEEGGVFGGLHSFADVVSLLGAVVSLDGLCQLNQAVDERFVADQRSLVMTDEQWHEWTSLVRQKAEELTGKG